VSPKTETQRPACVLRWMLRFAAPGFSPGTKKTDRISIGDGQILNLL
jgi:hypothetical protein